MEEFLSKACVQYNDYCGTVAADYKDGAIGLNEFLEERGVDLSIYLPYSIKLIFGENNFGGPRSTWVAVLAVKKEEVGENIKEILEYLNKQTEKSLPTYRLYFNVEVDEFFDLFKRFEIDLGYFSKSMLDYDDTVYADVQDEISLNE